MIALPVHMSRKVSFFTLFRFWRRLRDVLGAVRRHHAILYDFSFDFDAKMVPKGSQKGQREPEWSQKAPKGSQKMPKGSQKGAKRRQKPPKGSQKAKREPKGGARSEPKGAIWEPKLSQGLQNVPKINQNSQTSMSKASKSLTAGSWPLASASGLGGTREA